MSQVARHVSPKRKLYHWSPTSFLGGTEMAALTLIQQSPEIEHVVITGDKSGPAAPLWEQASAQVIELPGWRGFLGIQWSRAWARYVREHAVQRLICWSPTRLNLVLSTLPAQCHSLVHLGNVGALGWRARWLNRAVSFFRPTLCRVQLVTCSEAVLASAKPDPAFKAYRFLCIPNPVRQEFIKLGEFQRDQPFIPQRGGMVARLDRLKDHRTLIRAIHLLPREYDCTLEIVGAGPELSALQALVQELGLSERITFRGAHPRPWEVTRTWQFFFYATTAGEGFGIAVAEAMAAGLPAVVTDVPALREVAGPSVLYAREGCAVDFSAQIKALIDDPTTSALRAQVARQRVSERFAPADFTRRYLEALE